MANHILIIGPSWIGDMIMAQSLFITLKQQQPDRLIDVLAPGWTLPVLEHMPEVNKAINLPFGHGEIKLSERWRFGQALKKKYSQAILLPNSLKSAIVPFAAGIKKRTGWVGEFRYALVNDIHRLDKQKLTMTVQRFVALADAAPGSTIPRISPPKLQVRVNDVQRAMQHQNIVKKAQTKTLALCPGAEFGEAKRWPVKHFADLANLYLKRNWDIWLFGSDKDSDICAQINQRCDNACTDLSGRTSIAEAIDLLSLADAVVSNDSGLMHIAAALNRPLVAVYGSTDPGFTPPLNDKHRIVRLGLDCSPCFKRTCPLGHLDCLNNIDTGMVDHALVELLG